LKEAAVVAAASDTVRVSGKWQIAAEVGRG